MSLPTHTTHQIEDVTRGLMTIVEPDQAAVHLGRVYGRERADAALVMYRRTARSVNRVIDLDVDVIDLRDDDMIDLDVHPANVHPVSTRPRGSRPGESGLTLRRFGQPRSPRTGRGTRRDDWL